MKKSSPAKPAAGEPMRERILDAAFAAFFERGYAGASTLDIATRAKISKRELYAQFGSKRALLAAGIKERTARLAVPLEFPDIVNRQELERALTALATALLSLLTDEPVLALYRLAIAESTRAPELAATLNSEGHDASWRAFAQFLRNAQTRGLLVDDVTPEDLAVQFTSLALGGIQLQLLLRVAEPPAAADIERRAQKATELFLRLHAHGA